MNVRICRTIRIQSVKAMQTSGPIKDFAKYAQVSQQQFLRPLSPSELSDASIFVYRRSFRSLASLTLLPSLFVSGVVIVFFQLLYPYLFPKTEKDTDLVLQVLQTTILLVGGIGLSAIVALIGLSRICSFAHVLAEAALTDEDLSQSDIETRAQPLFGKSYRLLVRSSVYSLGVAFLSLLPLLLSGIFGALTASYNMYPAVAVGISLVILPVGLILALSRFSIALGTVSVGLAEGVEPKDALARAKYLFGNKSRPLPKANPAAGGIVAGACLYFILRIGYNATMNELTLSEIILSKMPTTLIRVIADTALSLIPEFLFIFLVLPFATLAGSLYYYQRRIVVEGLDIKTLYEKLPANRR